jgi:putative FmdB family regulatory protein
MPIYEYRCEQCGDFEEMQRITDPPLARCPKCKRKVRRLISNTSFQLKGSGWYVTDYARAGGGDGGKKDTTAGGDTTATSDSKPEKKAEAKPAPSTTGEKSAS